MDMSSMFKSLRHAGCTLMIFLTMPMVKATKCDRDAYLYWKERIKKISTRNPIAVGNTLENLKDIHVLPDVVLENPLVQEYVSKIEAYAASMDKRWEELDSKSLRERKLEIRDAKKWILLLTEQIDHFFLCHMICLKSNKKPEWLHLMHALKKILRSKTYYGMKDKTLRREIINFAKVKLPAALNEVWEREQARREDAQRKGRDDKKERQMIIGYIRIAMLKKLYSRTKLGDDDDYEAIVSRAIECGNIKQATKSTGVKSECLVQNSGTKKTTDEDEVCKKGDTAEASEMYVAPDRDTPEAIKEMFKYMNQMAEMSELPKPAEDEDGWAGVGFADDEIGTEI